jgi:hypothetical protein
MRDSGGGKDLVVDKSGSRGRWQTDICHETRGGRGAGECCGRRNGMTMVRDRSQAGGDGKATGQRGEGSK